MKFRLFGFQDRRCFYCKRIMRITQTRCPEQFTIDHTRPLCRGGRDNDENRVGCCNECNQVKGFMTAEEFIEWRSLPHPGMSKRDFLRSRGIALQVEGAR
ncbi:MAG: HNH endonuclease [Alphaproteobacteria bacterium]|nr:HNH endonuclease [Alphaproteobacteria bacterium]